MGVDTQITAIYKYFHISINIQKGKQRMKASAKKSQITKEYKKLESIYETVDADTYNTIKPMLQQAAFLIITLRDLQDVINENGAVEEYQNGENQKGYHVSPAVTSYNKLISNYNTIVKTLLSVNPAASDSDDGFEAFVKR